MVLVWATVLHDRSLNIIAQGIDRLYKVDVIEISVVSPIAINLTQKCSFNLRNLQAQLRVHDAHELRFGDKPPLGPVHILETRLQEHTSLPDCGPQAILAQIDSATRSHRQMHFVPPRWRCGVMVWHHCHGQWLLLQIRCRKSHIKVVDQVQVAKQTVIPHVPLADDVKLVLVNVSAEVHECEDGFHLTHSAITLSQRIEVLEVLFNTAARLCNPTLQLLHWVQLVMGPTCGVRLQDEVARGKWLCPSVHEFRDIVVKTHEMDVAVISTLFPARAVSFGNVLDVSL